MTNERINFLDIAKGISILCVVFGHSHLAKLLPIADQTIGLFRMPLFFFLAGIFFQIKKPASLFLAQKTDSLLKPYFVTLIALIPLEVVLRRIDNVPEALFGIAYGTGTTISLTPLWFLTHLWLIFVGSYLLVQSLNLIQQSTIVKVSVILVLFSSGSAMMGVFWLMPVHVGETSFNLQGLPFSLDMLPFSMAFFLTGFFLKEHLLTFRPHMLFLALALSMLVLIQMFTGARLGLVHRILQEPQWVLVACICGIYCILSASYYATRFNHLTKVLAFCGANSLFILIFHAPIENNLYKLFLRGVGDGAPITLSILSYAACVAISLALAICIRRIQPLRYCFLPIRSNFLAKAK